MESITKAELLQGLKALGVEKGMEVEVHSSLSRFGHVDGGAETVLAALMKSVGGDGSLFMPALRLSPSLPLTQQDQALGLTSKIRILPPDAERTAMGLIADTFRRRADVTTGEGVFRTSGWGKYGALAAESGLDHPLYNGGMGLLLGVDIYKLTAMHYVEELLPPQVGEIFRPSAEAQALYPEEKWLIEAGMPPCKPWYTIWDMALQRGLVRQGKIGNADCALFKLWDVVGLYEQELKRDALGLYGIG